MSLSDDAENAQARPDLSIQDITALLVSLTNLSLSCYPDRLEYVDQVLGFAADKIKEFSERFTSSRHFIIDMISDT